MAIGVIGGSANSFDYDMSNGSMTPYSGAQRNGIAVDDKWLKRNRTLRNAAMITANIL
mgnify:CR=1 FL=1